MSAFSKIFADEADEGDHDDIGHKDLSTNGEGKVYQNSRQVTSTKWQVFANASPDAPGVTRCAGTPRRKGHSPRCQKREKDRPIGTEMGAKKCYATHKVIQPWAADTVSLRELPICESLPAHDGPAAQAIHPWLIGTDTCT